MPSISNIGKLRNKITIQNTNLTTDKSTYIRIFNKIQR